MKRPEMKPENHTNPKILKHAMTNEQDKLTLQVVTYSQGNLHHYTHNNS